jgi:hypothetical protein
LILNKIPNVFTKFFLAYGLLLLMLAAVFIVAPSVSAQDDTPTFRIIAVSEHDGQLLVEVEHFKANGSFDYFENYLWQGREGTKHPIATNANGRALLTTGQIAPFDVDGVQYLPKLNEWKRETGIHLGNDSILGVIQQIHDQRREWVDEDWPRGIKRGQSRLTEVPIPIFAEDSAGISTLIAKFADLADTAYLPNEAGILTPYSGKLPGVNPGLGLVEYGTVSTFYTGETGSGDGAAQQSADSNWATMRGAAGDGSNDTAASRPVFIQFFTGSTWSGFGRLIFVWNTATLPDGDTVDSAVINFTVASGPLFVNDFNDSISLVVSAPASDTAVANGDYDSLGTTVLAPNIAVSAIPHDDVTDTTYTLNAAGLANISLTAASKFGLRSDRDRDNNEPVGPGTDDATNLYFYQAEEVEPGDERPALVVTHSLPPTAAITGTIGDGATEQEVRDGGGTILITLSSTTWVADGATFDAQRQNIIDGLVAADSQTYGWNNEVKANLGVTAVERSSDTLVTITIPAGDVEDYRIVTNEVITTTVPATAIVGSALVATPTTTITGTVESAAVTGTLGGSGGTSAEIIAGGETIIITLTNTTWVADGATFNAQRQNILDGLVSDGSETNGWDSLAFAVGDVDRTNATVVTITLSAESDFGIYAAETITTTVPATAIVYGAALVAPETFTITPTFTSTGTWISPAIDLSSIIDTAYCAVGWSESIPAGTSAAVEYSSDGGGSYSTATNGSCPFTIASSLAAVSDFRIKVTLTTTDATATPTITALGFIAGTTAGQTVRYQLNTTPALTATDRTGNGYSGTMSFPALPSGVTTTVGSMTALRAPPSAQTARGIPQVTSPVTGTAVSANIFNTDETGWTGLPGYQLVNTMATAGDGLPVQFIWYIMLGLVTIMLGFFALNLTQSLFAAGVAMALGLGASIAMGGGLIPGWVIFVFIPVAIGMIFLRPRLAI